MARHLDGTTVTMSHPSQWLGLLRIVVGLYFVKALLHKMRIPLPGPLDATTLTMSHPSQWLALLRIVVGLYFVKSLITKMSIVLLGGVLPVPAVSARWLTVMPKIVAKQASDNPLNFYKEFLEGTVLTHSNT